MTYERPSAPVRTGHPWAQLHPATPADPAPSSSVRRFVLLAAWIALLVVVVVGVAGAGAGALAPPDLTDPGSWHSWAMARTAPEAAVAVLALGVQVVAGYLLVVTLLALAATVWRGRGLVSVVDILTFPAVRRVLQGVVGVSLATASIAAVGAGPAGGRGAVATADVQLARSDRAVAAADVEVMRTLPHESSPPTPPAPVMQRIDPVDRAPAPPTPVTTEVTVVEWKVEPGDHLWSIASRLLGDAGLDVGEAAVAAYADALVDANRDRFADAGNPDLLYPGQRLVLPPPTAR